MARKPKHKNISDLILYSTNSYYLFIREKNPKLKYNKQDHEQTLLKVIHDFNSELSRRHPDWNTEEVRQAFKNHLDFLTRIFTNKAKEQKQKDSIQAYLDEIRNARGPMAK